MRIIYALIVIIAALCGTRVAHAQGRIERLAPQAAAPGGHFEIRGSGFGDDASHQRDASVVEIYKVVNRSALRWHLRVLTWSDQRITAGAPVDLEPGEYGLHVGVPNTLRWSNQTRLTVAAVDAEAAPDNEEPWIERISPTYSSGGMTVEIHGRRFGRLGQHDYVQIQRRDGSDRAHLAVVRWSDRFIRVQIPVHTSAQRIAAGRYQLQVVREDAGDDNISVAYPSNRKEIILRDHDWSEHMYLDAVEPESVRAGGEVDLIGRNLERQNDDWYVRLTRVTDGRELAVHVSQWHNGMVRAPIPNEAPPGEYRVMIGRRDRPFLSTQRRALTIVAVQPTRASGGAGNRRRGEAERISGRTGAESNAEASSVGGMYISSLSRSIAAPGETLAIEGERFGPRQGSRIVAINHGRLNRMDVVSWSDQRIVVRVPAELAAGDYRVLVYYDASLRTSSNSLAVTLRDAAMSRVFADAFRRNARSGRPGYVVRERRE